MKKKSPPSKLFPCRDSGARSQFLRLRDYTRSLPRREHDRPTIPRPANILYRDFIIILSPNRFPLIFFQHRCVGGKFNTEFSSIHSDRRYGFVQSQERACVCRFWTHSAHLFYVRAEFGTNNRNDAAEIVSITQYCEFEAFFFSSFFTAEEKIKRF